MFWIAIAGIAVTLLALLVSVIYTIVVPLCFRLWDFLTHITDQILKKIYEWVFKIFNNLKSVLKKMGIAWSDEDEELPQNRFMEFWNKIFGKEGKFSKFAVEKSEKIIGNVYSLKDFISYILKLINSVEGIPLSKSKGSTGEQAEKQDGSELNVVNAGLEVPAEPPAEEDPVITRLDNLAAQITEMNSSLQAKDKKAPAEDDMAEIKEMFQRIEGALGLGDITAALKELKAELQAVVQPVGEGEGGATTGEKLDIIEAKLTGNEAKLAEQTNDLGIEVRDSKRSLQFDINEVKAKLDRLIKEIEKKAMTFDQIYDMLCIRIVREHRNSTGRILREKG